MKEKNHELVRSFIEALLEVASNKTARHDQNSAQDEKSETYEYEVITGEEILQMEGDSLPYLIDPLFPKSGLVGFGGSSDTGKSTFLKQLATAVARGESQFLGFPLHVTHRSVIYVSTEDDKDAVKTVLKMQRKKGTRASTIKGLRFLFYTERIYEQVARELKRSPADVVIIDALSDIVSGDLNQSSVVRPFLDKFSNLSKKHECLIIFLHHTSKKAEGQVPKKGNLLGSQGFEAKCRLVALLVRDPLEDHIRHFCLVKGNYLSDEYKSKSYVLKFNEDLTFDYTNDRVPLEDLKESEDKQKKKKELQELQKRAWELREQGWKLESIAKEVKRHPSRVSCWLKEMVEENEAEKRLEENVPVLKEKLAEFAEDSEEFIDLEDLRAKYQKGKRGFKDSTREKFRAFLGTKKGVKVAIFSQLIED